MKRTFSAASLLALSLSPAAGLANPKELGDVRFGRDLEAALQESKKSEKPVLILFDEIPGCSTCQGYGDAVLRQPLIVEAAESLFLPVAIYNNKGGKDGEALQYFDEPSWNNPVVRIVDADKKMLAPRVNGDYTPAGLARAMVAALEAAKRPVPSYLSLFAEEAAAEASGTSRAYFTMYCFWSGEACLGDIAGVIASRTGFLEGNEAVEVEYDPSRLTYRALVERVKTKRCASKAFARTDAEEKIAREIMGADAARTSEILRPSEKDDKYNLAQSAWRAVPMTRTQQTKANSYIAEGKDPSPLLSPRQLSARSKL